MRDGSVRRYFVKGLLELGGTAAATGSLGSALNASPATLVLSTIATVSGAGCIRHMWMTVSAEEPDYVRRVVLGIAFGELTRYSEPRLGSRLPA
jgi:hypothetical protein